MLILLDHGTPQGIAAALVNHSVSTAYSRGWAQLSNGLLLQAAEQAGFDVLLTTDRRIRYQQNLATRRIAIVVLAGSTKCSRVRLYLQDITAAVDSAKAGSYAEVVILFR